MSPSEPTREPPPILHPTHPPISRRRNARTLWIVVAGLLLLGLGIAWLIHRAPTAKAPADRRGAAPAVMPVGTAPVKLSDVNVYLSGLGTVTPRANVVVRTRVAGQLMSVLFSEGQMVARNQLLAEIDPRPYRAALEQAQGQLLRDQALLANARLDLARYNTLYAQNSTSKQILDTQAALVKQDEGVVKADQGTVDTAQVNLDYTRITAPVAGRIGLRQVDPGNVVQPSDTNGIVVITQLQPIDVVFTIPQDDIPRVLAPLRAKTLLAVDAYDRDQKTRLATGALLTMDNQIDSTTGTVKLKAAFDNTEGALFPNQFVNIQMLVDVLKNSIVAPLAGIQRGSQGTFAYVVNANDTVSVVPVTTGTVQADQVVITKGLVPGQTIVVDGADKLRDGAKVEPIDRTLPVKVTPPAAPISRHGVSHTRGHGKTSDPSAKASN